MVAGPHRLEQSIQAVGACGGGDSSPRDGQEAESETGSGQGNTPPITCSSDLLPPARSTS
jgi:hypothetical protein